MISREQAELIAQTHREQGDPDVTADDVLAQANTEIDFTDWSAPRLFDTVLQSLTEIARRHEKTLDQVVTELFIGVTGAEVMPLPFDGDGNPITQEGDDQNF